VGKLPGGMQAASEARTQPALAPDAVVLLSGGIDSTTALAWARRLRGWRCAAISFDYGQRHSRELEAAKRVAKALGVVEHRIVKVDLAAIGGSALTDRRLPVPMNGPKPDEIPITYVPARNIVFLSLAAGFAETLGCSRLVIGANIMDYSGYPDCRPEFLDAFAEALRRGTKLGATGKTWRIEAPLLKLRKTEILRLGISLGVDYALTHSCYAPREQQYPCGHCDSCRFRLQAFAELGIPDPALAALRDEHGACKPLLHFPAKGKPPAICYVCGASEQDILPLLRGYPAIDLIEKYERGGVVSVVRFKDGRRYVEMGGCLFYPEAPRWQCIRCGAYYGRLGDFP